jgi:hypothetical protein
MRSHPGTPLHNSDPSKMASVAEKKKRVKPMVTGIQAPLIDPASVVENEPVDVQDLAAPLPLS